MAQTTINAVTLQQQVESIKQDTGKLIAGLTQESINWRPLPHQWSIGQCLEHLSVTGHKYLPKMSEAVTRTREAGFNMPGNYRMGLLGKFFTRIMEPPVKLKVKAPRDFVPAKDLEMDSVVTRFMTLQDTFNQHILEADGVDWGKVKFVSPVSSLIKFNLTEGLAMLIAHERRHLWQAWQVRNHPDFPK